MMAPQCRRLYIACQQGTLVQRASISGGGRRAPSIGILESLAPLEAVGCLIQNAVPPLDAAQHIWVKPADCTSMSLTRSLKQASRTQRAWSR